MTDSRLQHSPTGTLVAACPPSVLVIDDDQHFRALARCLLEAAGMSVIEAAGIQQGLDRLRTQAIDAVILDLVMPDEDGIAGMQRIKAAYPATKVLAVSGARSGGAYLRACSHLGANATLAKAYVERLCPLVEVMLGPKNGTTSLVA